MTENNRVLVVRVALGVLMTVMGAMMLAGCPVNAQPPLNVRAVDAVVVPADR